MTLFERQVRKNKPPNYGRPLVNISARIRCGSVAQGKTIFSVVEKRGGDYEVGPAFAVLVVGDGYDIAAVGNRFFAPIARAIKFKVVRGSNYAGERQRIRTVDDIWTHSRRLSGMCASPPPTSG